MTNQLIKFEELTDYKIDDKYKRGGKMCIFDPIREMLVISTPEELLRQQIIRYFLEKLRIPQNMIEVEVPMSRFKKSERGRADIIVYGKQNDIDFPLLVVECKAPAIPINDFVWDQIHKYDEVLKSPFLMVTNGHVTEAMVWHCDDEEFKLIDEMPNYESMCSMCDIEIAKDNTLWKRPSFSSLLGKNNIKEFYDSGWLGVDTQEDIIPFILNLGGLLQDDYLEIEPFRFEGIKVIESGNRNVGFGNAGGGILSGYFRYFLLEDNIGNNQIISMTTLGLGKFENDPRWGNRRASTVLIVAIDDNEKRHNSLELSMDKYVRVTDETYDIWHDGTLTKGKSGAVKRSKVLDFIQSKAPELIQENEIYLGSFPKHEEILWEHENTKSFIRKLIKYALLRDEFRQM